MSTDGAGDATGSGVEFVVVAVFELRFVFVVLLFRVSRCEFGHPQPSTASRRITNAKFPLCERLKLNLDIIELFLFSITAYFSVFVPVLSVELVAALFFSTHSNKVPS